MLWGSIRGGLEGRIRSYFGKLHGYIAGVFGKRLGSGAKKINGVVGPRGEPSAGPSSFTQETLATGVVVMVRHTDYPVDQGKLTCRKQISR